jgi:hypothetical protein
MIEIVMGVVGFRSVDVLMETKGSKKKSSSSSGSKQYEFPLGYVVEDIRPNGGIKKFRSAAYSNVSPFFLDRSERKQEKDSFVFLNVFLIVFFFFFWIIFLCSARGSHLDTSKESLLRWARISFSQ